jgi:hypothetical protein
VWGKELNNGHEGLSSQSFGIIGGALSDISSFVLNYFSSVLYNQALLQSLLISRENIHQFNSIMLAVVSHLLFQKQK